MMTTVGLAGHSQAQQENADQWAMLTNALGTGGRGAEVASGKDGRGSGIGTGAGALKWRVVKMVEGQAFAVAVPRGSSAGGHRSGESLGVPE